MEKEKSTELYKKIENLMYKYSRKKRMMLRRKVTKEDSQASPLPIAHCPADRKTMPNSDAEIPQTILPATQQESAAGLSSPAPILTAIESLS